MTVRLIGIGGFGIRIAEQMSSEDIEGVSLAVIDTDRDEVENSEIDNALKIGEESPLGGGTNGWVTLGAKAAAEAFMEIGKMVSDVDIVLIVAGLGGGTGTGAAPVVAKMAHEKGVHVCAAVKNPFTFEGAQKAEYSLEGIKSLKDTTDNLCLYDIKFVDGKSDSLHHPESFGVDFSKTDIKEISKNLTMDQLFDLIYSNILEYVKSLAECSSLESLKSSGNTFTGYTAPQNANTVYSVLGGLY